MSLVTSEIYQFIREHYLPVLYRIFLENSARYNMYENRNVIGFHAQFVVLGVIFTTEIMIIAIRPFYSPKLHN